MRSIAIFLVVLGLLPACQSSSAAEEGVPAPPPTLGRWTDAFLQEAIAVAEVIEIEGPPALRDHFVLPQDPLTFTTTTTATDFGLLHVVVAKGGMAEIRANLDRWELVATRRLEVLERPGETDVVVEMRGNALLQRFSTEVPGSVTRGAELSVVGELTP